MLTPSIKFQKLEKILLVVIAIFGAFLYLYKLGNNPPGLYIDEAGTGYNAYSILKTGKDEYGKAFPIAMRLFGSYSPPLYIYLSVPIMALFGMSIFSTRLLSAICGVVLIFTIHLLLKSLKITKSKYTPLVATLFFAITPWLVFYSRTGYEMNIALLFFATSALFAYKALQNPRLLQVAIPLFSLSTYADYSQRVIAPILFVSFLYLFRKKIFTKKNKRFLVLGSLVAFLIQIPNLVVATTPSFYTKLDHFYISVVSAQSAKVSIFLPVFISNLLAFAREFLSKYFAFFSPRSLFFLPNSDLQQGIPEMSVFYSWMIIPYLIGLHSLWKIRKTESAKFVFTMLLVTPLPGALTKEPFHIQRTLTLLVPLTMVLAVGIDNLIHQKKLKQWLPVFVLTTIFSLVMFWRSYFVLLPQQRAYLWGGGFEELTDYIRNHPDETFLIDQSGRTRPKDVAYTQIAFHLPLPPEELQKDQLENIAKNYYYDTDFSFEHKFANVEFRNIEWGETKWRDIILVGDLVSISDLEVGLHSLTEVFEIRDPNNNILFRGFKTNPTLLE